MSSYHCCASPMARSDCLPHHFPPTMTAFLPPSPQQCAPPLAPADYKARFFRSFFFSVQSFLRLKLRILLLSAVTETQKNMFNKLDQILFKRNMCNVIMTNITHL